MSDDLMNTGPRDRSNISLSEDWEVKYWTTALGCSAIELKDAVQAVGRSAAAVKIYLEGLSRKR